MKQNILFTDDWRSSIPSGALIITDSTVSEYYAAGLRRITFEAGEPSKTMGAVQWALDALAAMGCDRQTTVVALGGGVVGDLAGFVASIYMRGVPLIQIPTTLMAMVDSAIGGKTGVNLPAGKNLAGTFYPAQSVIINTSFLDTLPPRELRSGRYEIVKYAVISNDLILPQLSHADAIRRCVEIKQEIVVEDPHERTGKREWLNFGHTIGHALEKVMGYGVMTHGEAVGVGMVIESEIARRRLGFTGAELVRGMVDGVGTKLSCAAVPPDDILSACRLDKKNTCGWIRMCLPKDFGDMETVEVSDEVILDCLKE